VNLTELQEIQQKKEEILAVARQYGIVNVRIFGSVARGDDNPQSDIDFLVDLEEGCTLFDLGGALVKLQDLLGRKVDIVTKNGLHWYLREKIMKEARSL
jgi:predicted nucleotidyltransferase